MIVNGPHTDVTGSGPTLLLIPGGPLDASEFAGLAPRLADDFTGVTYDPRGLSRGATAATRVEVGVGATAAEGLANRAAVAFAERFGRAPVEFPGGHNGFAGDPEEFAVVLRKVLS